MLKCENIDNVSVLKASICFIRFQSLLREYTYTDLSIMYNIHSADLYSNEQFNTYNMDRSIGILTM